MDSQLKIFISAVSQELKTASSELAETLRLLDFNSVLQAEFLSHQEVTCGMLEADLGSCSVMIQLVGQRYGRVVSDASSAISCNHYHTQYAQKKSLPIWYFVIAESFRSDAPNPEDSEKKALQKAYRSKIQGAGSHCIPIRTLADIEAAVLSIRDELLGLRETKPLKPNSMASLSLAYPTPNVTKTAVSSALKKTALIKVPPTFLSDFLSTLQEVQQGDADDEARREQEQYTHLAMIMGKTPEDARTMIRALAQKTILDPNEPLLELAKAAFLLKQYSQAEALALKAVTVLKDPEIKTEAFYQAGQAAAEQVQPLRALEHYRSAATFAREQHAPADWARVQHMIAYTLDDLGRANEAEEILLKVIQVRETALGSDHADTLVSRNNLAMAYEAQGKHAEEEHERRLVLAIRERIFSPENPATLRTRIHLANALKSQGKHSEAAKERAAAEAIQQRIAESGAAGMPVNASTATEKYRNVLHSMEQLYGPSHQDTLVSRRKLADALEAVGKFTEAETEYRTVLTHTEGLYGPQDPDTLSSRNSLAIFLYSQANFAGAVKELRTVLLNMELVHGKEHYKVFRCCYNLAACLLKQEKTEEALAQAERAFHGWSQTLGESHSDTEDAAKMIDRIKNP